MFERDCGATTGSSAQVSVVDPGEIPEYVGNAFRSDGDAGHAGTKARSSSAVEAQWLSSGALVVRYASALRIFSKEPDVHGVRITYQPTEQR
ncbi:hypothetical protein [Antarcticirhabdus aurantiaca]|uniref:hypothetical protein n=1 Tax=Antarcticirhabdus aurantiaca TaxID=2606717 RepID=UPI00131BE3F6|nr:hypothetical protein [Antarcticirhabdus aurantiaca]